MECMKRFQIETELWSRLCSFDYYIQVESILKDNSFFSFKFPNVILYTCLCSRVGDQMQCTQYVNINNSELIHFIYIDSKEDNKKLDISNTQLLT